MGACADQCLNQGPPEESHCRRLRRRSWIDGALASTLLVSGIAGAAVTKTRVCIPAPLRKSDRMKMPASSIQEVLLRTLWGEALPPREFRAVRIALGANWVMYPIAVLSVWIVGGRGVGTRQGTFSPRNRRFSAGFP